MIKIDGGQLFMAYKFVIFCDVGPIGDGLQCIGGLREGI